MQCTRAAVVAYEIEASPLALADGDIPQELPITLTLKARLNRRLVMCQDTTAWPDSVAAPLLSQTAIPVWEEKATIVPDTGMWKQWHKQEREIDRMRKLWDKAVKTIMGTVPRKTLSALVDLYATEEAKELPRFGQQVDALFTLPEDAKTLSQCVSVVENLARWIQPDEMMDMAENHYRLVTRAGEDRAMLVEEITGHYNTLIADVKREFLDESARGHCVPEERYAFLRDTLFVFDGQYSEDEMQMLMSEYMRSLQERMQVAAEERDTLRNMEESERPSEIPERVRTYVWRRDMARCAVCGSVQDLEFDHIIPRSRGGASTVGNVQIICASCNEKKRAQVARIPSEKRHTAKEDETLSLFNGDDEDES